MQCEYFTSLFSIITNKEIIFLYVQYGVYHNCNLFSTICTSIISIKKIWKQPVVCNEKYLIRFNFSSKLQIYFIPKFYIRLGKTYFFHVCQADYANGITWYDRNFIFFFIKSKLCKTFSEIPCIWSRDVERKVLHNPYLPKKSSKLTWMVHLYRTETNIFYFISSIGLFSLNGFNNYVCRVWYTNDWGDSMLCLILPVSMFYLGSHYFQMEPNTKPLEYQAYRQRCTKLTEGIQMMYFVKRTLYNTTFTIKTCRLYPPLIQNIVKNIPLFELPFDIAKCVRCFFFSMRNNGSRLPILHRCFWTNILHSNNKIGISFNFLFTYVKHRKNSMVICPCTS